MLYEKDGRLVYSYDGEKLWIEPWSANAFRVRATKLSTMPTENWALQQPLQTGSQPTISVSKEQATITNGKIEAVVTNRGKVTFYNATGTVVLEEYARNRRDVLDPNCSAIQIEAREFKPIRGGDFHLTMRFESLDPREKIFGMGQYQQPYLDLKGLDLEMAQRNSQASVPFALSSL
ncbi:hypothetical protein VD0004_g234 [Verticillium dahliae]|nr:hypothetical protein VD0004_g234 [Verticillium dahliae]